MNPYKKKWLFEYKKKQFAKALPYAIFDAVFSFGSLLILYFNVSDVGNNELLFGAGVCLLMTYFVFVWVLRVNDRYDRE